MKCASNIAGILTNLSCLGGHLPTGSPLSPILSFFAHIDIWENIHEIAKTANCVLTVYIDDVTLSGEKVTQKIIWAVKKELHKAGLQYHKEKAYQRGWSEITGVIVKDGNLVLPNRTLKIMHALRQAIRNQGTPSLLSSNLTELVSMSVFEKTEVSKDELISKLKSYQNLSNQLS